MGERATAEAVMAIAAGSSLAYPFGEPCWQRDALYRLAHIVLTRGPYVHPEFLVIGMMNLDLIVRGAASWKDLVELMMAIEEEVGPLLDSESLAVLALSGDPLVRAVRDALPVGRGRPATAVADVPRCTQCGAQALELICKYCGTLVEPTEHVGAQMQALREFHTLLQAAGAERQQQLLTAGYFPSQWQVLVEAGLQCLPLLKDGEADEVSLAASNRLDAISARLRLHGDKPEAQRAAADFEARLERFRRAERNLMVLALGVVAVIVALVVWGITAYLKRN
ncbi:hypothetical protein LZC95_48465 [Pendulispora brunnea]|uniref:Zinc ribbon domain-containing protein n=1 Tax=Pendulispora brunnea TaxID=2905690 RepID=A0ABZ2KBK6_9BACT